MNKTTISLLKEKGWQVKLFRYHNVNLEAVKRDDMKLLPYRFIKGLVGRFVMGGKVVAEIIPPMATTIFRGEWICHPMREFNFKKGIERAFEAALKKAGIHVR